MVAISLCVLLLATYCYSVPVNQRLSVTTPDYEFTTGHTIVDHNNRINMHLMSDAESTGVPSLHQQRKVMGSESSEYTTSVPYGEHIGHASRVLNESSTEDPAEATFIHNFDKFHFTTMESKTHFQKKAIGPARTESEEARETESESKREFPEKDSEEKETESESKRAFFGNDVEATTYSSLSGLPTTTYQSMRFAESRENSREQPTTTYQSMNSAESRENLRQKPTTTYQSMNSAESRENLRQQPSTTYQSIHSAENSREQPSTTYRSIITAQNSREQPSSVDSFGRNTGLLRKQQPSASYQSINSAQNSREQPSSVDSFGRNTVLLRKQQPKVVQMTRPVEQSNEEMSTQSSQILRQKPIVTKTETIFPVKVTETKYFVPKQPVVETAKSNN